LGVFVTMQLPSSSWVLQLFQSCLSAKLYKEAGLIFALLISLIASFDKWNGSTQYSSPELVTQGLLYCYGVSSIYFSGTKTCDVARNKVQYLMPMTSTAPLPPWFHGAIWAMLFIVFSLSFIQKFLEVDSTTFPEI
jgi:hypothetical protein